MILYKLVNPSDKYTFKAKTREVAALCISIFGPAYGANVIDNVVDNVVDNNIPVLLFQSFDEWFEQVFKKKVTESYYQNIDDLIICLDSFVLGGEKDREIYETAINSITDADKLKEFLDKWNDKRSSCNDIGAYAKHMSKKMKVYRKSKEV